MRVEGHVGETSVTDGCETIPIRLGRMGEVVTTELHGRYYEQCARGNVYYAMTATAGIALITSATTGGHPTLFNPMGSNVNFSLIRLYISRATTGGDLPTGLAWAYTYNCGSTQATAAAIKTFTRGAAPSTINNALVGGRTSSMGSWGAWAPATNTFTIAPLLFGGVGVSQVTEAATGTNNPYNLVIDYDGTLVVPPGNAISLVSTTALSTTTALNVSVCWEEIPVIIS